LIKFVSSNWFAAKSVEQLRVEQSQFEQFTPTQLYYKLCLNLYQPYKCTWKDIQSKKKFFQLLIFQIPDSRLPLPTSSLIRTSRYSRHFEKGHFKWTVNNKQQVSKPTSEERQIRTNSLEKNSETLKSPKKFSLCMTGIESSDDSDSPRQDQVRKKVLIQQETNHSVYVLLEKSLTQNMALINVIHKLNVFGIQKQKKLDFFITSTEW
jgi:hypothetical protein